MASEDSIPNTLRKSLRAFRTGVGVATLAAKPLAIAVETGALRAAVKAAGLVVMGG